MKKGIRIMAKKIELFTPPTHDEIATCAFRIYQEEGCFPGRELDHWLRAEAELLAEKRNGNGLSKKNRRTPQPSMAA